MTRREWVASVIGWDGALPLIVIAVPLALEVVGAGDVLAMGAAALVPTCAALLRAHHGQRQIEERVGGRAPIVRQLAFGLALIVLLAFEALTGMLLQAQGAPPAIFLIPAGLYVVYLGLVLFALRPVARVVTTR